MATSALPPLPAPYARAHELIDAAHAEDPNTVADNQGDGANKVPYELNYARKMTRFLAQHSPDASPELQLACRAQHFRRLGPAVPPPTIHKLRSHAATDGRYLAPPTRPPALGT